MNYLIVGLGNPGPQYAHTRHNIGFDVLEALADSLKISFKYESKFLCEMAQYKNTGNTFYLVKPQTFMNLSGESVVKIKKFYKTENILVVHDELDIAFGAIRFKVGGSSGGHNGLKSLDTHCGNSYQRLRFGIGRDAAIPVVNYVLAVFKETERDKKEKLIKHCVSALIDYLEYRDFKRLQNFFTLKDF
ncbi:aminoacyl-tRNA hydrolase [Helicobacter anatolicus]|uniref:aminoacyl-tRNA hydrolase n=1 Tax=Helicobacter anatolicus TaxID=2905874 RepID=UPI001E4F336F|nr:aminoacyl-tRNA hydrolase [Helicobacter anatolicus]MCE3039466.1 aminoacyl-tRNA hydrolase [Helicobacter anatolicus]